MNALRQGTLPELPASPAPEQAQTLTDRLGWYLRRAARMSPAEVVWRTRDQVVRAAWARRQVLPGQALAALPAAPAGGRGFTAVLPPGTVARVPRRAGAGLLAAADALLAGEWEVLGVTRTDLVRPDWFGDPVTGRSAPCEKYAFRINHRSQEQTGNIKQVWELSRLQHLTLLATAWYLTGDERYARRVAEQLTSWWRENPFLSGVHWTSGIELGIRLISFAWIRRLLDSWPGAAGLFEQNPLAVRQIYWHQCYLAAFRSRGSSANNHVIAEAAGQLVASCAFGWFRESGRWRRDAARLLEAELLRNTFPSGINRELASDYQCFVAELCLLAAAEAAAAGSPLSGTAWQRLCAMVDSSAALLDERLRPPRQGDGDEGRALLLDAPAANRWPSLLALGEELFGRLTWWPDTTADVSSTLISELACAGTGSRAGRPARTAAGRPASGLTAGRPTRQPPGARPASRPARFADAGITVLRAGGGRLPEIWCRCDGGPHGFLGIAAHAHADALSVEVRYAGVDVLADPGTYCYHGEPEWRSYFRSTIGHNTVEVGGRNSSTEGGPFLWLRHANAKETEYTDEGDVATWAAEHDGYASLRPPARHRRLVSLNRACRSLDIADDISGGHEVRLAFHLGPDVAAELDGATASLCWPLPPDGAPPSLGAPAATALLELPGQLQWSMHRGETSPVLGWYSHGLGRKTPAFTLTGRGRPAPGTPLTTRLTFLDLGNQAKPDS